MNETKYHKGIANLDFNQAPFKFFKNDSRAIWYIPNSNNICKLQVSVTECEKKR